MRKADLIARHDGFRSYVDWYRDFLNRVTSAQRVLQSAEDKREIAEMIVLRLCAHWEYYIDELLVAAINRDHSQLSEHFGVSIPPHPSAAHRQRYATESVIVAWCASCYTA